MFGLGGWEVVLLLAVVLLLFGAKRLPDLAKGLGTGIKEFKKATREVTDEIQNAANDTPPLLPLRSCHPPTRPPDAVGACRTPISNANEGHLKPGCRAPQRFTWPSTPDQRLTRKTTAAAR